MAAGLALLTKAARLSPHAATSRVRRSISTRNSSMRSNPIGLLPDCERLRRPAA